MNCILKKSGFSLVFNESKEHFDKVIIASGGSPKAQGFDWLQNIGHAIINPIPSLFPFNMPEEPVKNLMGVVVENATANSRYKTTIHWSYFNYPLGDEWACDIKVIGLGCPLAL